MKVTFKQGSITYRLLILPEGRREQEAREQEICKPTADSVLRQRKQAPRNRRKWSSGVPVV